MNLQSKNYAIDEVEKITKIKVKYKEMKYFAFSEEFTIFGYGNTQTEAKYDFVCKLLCSLGQRSKLVKKLTKDIKDAPLTISHEFVGNWHIITITDELGRSREIEIPLEKK